MNQPSSSGYAQKLSESPELTLAKTSPHPGRSHASTTNCKALYGGYLSLH
ncbi:hypothetical protein [Leptolyngbya sp. FACHB-16]|nr:hypothetical protein [Leptolyngbya sp. FACHB-16]MBD1910647.1 hypothetical protein [Leptolyngbya sp. FACHB-8]MBD2154587.1 hypothetical protein [Leptolyngbya sp. FACHB-16]